MMKLLKPLGAFICFLLIFGGMGAGAAGFYQRWVELRGRSDPTTAPALPDRVPLPGVNVDLTQYDARRRAREMDRITAAGFVWLRQTFLWSDIEPQPGEFDFSRYDPIIEEIAARPKLRLLAVLDGAPRWARRPEASAADRLYAPPASMAAFGRFANALATRYADKIDFYQIWDEPNLNTHWGGLDPRPADYAAMLKAAYPAIKAADPLATVITAGFAPTVETGPRNLSDVLFLRALYEAGARDSFDAVAGKPYGFDFPPTDRTVDEGTLNFSRIILLREEMVRQGDGHKAVWGCHFGWNHLPEGWSGSPSIWGQVSAQQQRDYTRAAYARAAREWPWLGGLILQAWQPAAPTDDPIQGFDASTWFDAGIAAAAVPGNGDALGVGVFHATDARLSYVGNWRFGPLGADVQIRPDETPPADGSAHLLTFVFEGDSLAFKVRRGDYVAYLYVRIDGKPANALPIASDSRGGDGEAYLLMRSPTLDPRTEVIVAARRLGPGLHRAEVRAYLGYERWMLAGVAIGPLPEPSPARYDLLIVLGAGLLLAGGVGTWLWLRALPRGAVPSAAGNLTAYMRRMAGVIGTLALSILTVIGLTLTLNNFLPGALRRDLPALAVTVAAAGLLYLSPALILTVAALIALWLIVYNRPVIGLALITFWAPFFLTPVELYRFALPMVEISLLLTLSAAAVRAVMRRFTPLPGPRSIQSMEKGSGAPAEGKFRGAPGEVKLADRAMLAFVVMAIISIAWAEQINPATRELRIMVIEPALFYLLMRLTPLTREDRVRLVDVFLLSGFIVSAIGLVQFVGGGPGVTLAEQGARRLMSVYSSPNNLALFLGRCIPFGVAMTLLAPDGVRRLVAGVFTLVMLVALVLTQSAGAGLLGLPAALAVVLLLWDRRRGLILVGALALLLLALVPLGQFIPRLQGALDLTRTSSFTRTQLWTSTLNLLRERPITGAGLDQFLYLYRSRYILPEAWQEPNLSHPHNLVLDYWVRLGILGLPILGALQFAFWRGGWRAWRSLRARDRLLTALVVGAMGSMADFLAHGLVDNSYFVVDLAYIFCFTLGLVMRLASAAPPPPPDSQNPGEQPASP